MITVKITVNSMTSGNPLVAEIIQTSKIRKFFGMRYLKVRAFYTGKLTWSEATWYFPSEVNGYRP